MVEMHHFCGLSHEIVAESPGLTVYRVRQKWTYARAWLRDGLKRWLRNLKFFARSARELRVN